MDSLVLDALQEQWNRAFPGVPLVAHRFRDHLASRWVRLHALPDSKRYPQTEAEYETILRRHTTLLSELGGPDDSIVIRPAFSDLAAPTIGEELEDCGPVTFWRTLTPSEIVDDYDVPYVHLYQLARPFLDEALQRLLRSVADDKIAGVFIFNCNAGWIYHPYDGGADIILPSEEAARATKELHASWLPRNPNGL